MNSKISENLVNYFELLIWICLKVEYAHVYFCTVNICITNVHVIHEPFLCFYFNPSHNIRLFYRAGFETANELPGIPFQ